MGKQRCLTDAKGEFYINGLTGQETVIISYIGYVSREILAVDIAKYPNIILKASLLNLREVVVNTGYQTLSNERATGSFSVISDNDIANKMQTNILSKLEGQAAGYSTFKGTALIRGTSSILGVSAPLYVVDGFPYEGDISALNPWDVESVTILKDAAHHLFTVPVLLMG
jgi:hypothetical protein